MNKYQIALTELKRQLVVVDYLDGKAVSQEPIFEEQTETLQELIDIYPEYLELKERATPKKVKVVPSDILYFDGVCPNCNKPLFDGTDMFFKEKRYKFCAYCGQAIDWSESTTDLAHNELDNIFADDLEMLERLKIKK